ncbi:ATP-binding protein [Bradyrhizobium sp. RDM12]
MHPAFPSGSLQVLWQDSEVAFCRGTNQTDINRTVLAVVPMAEQPSPANLDRLVREFLLKERLEPDWAIRPLELKHDRGRTMLILEDPGGQPLIRLLGSPLEIEDFLSIATSAAAALGKMHNSGLIHKDIKPSNIVVGCADGRVRLTGFSIASRLLRERQAPHPPETIAGTFAYMAPEQTGRMNRSIDIRSDLYSFGITLYQMLTGVQPFTASDPMGWIHCHVARQPVPPAERVTGIPHVVSAIVMKLLAKAAENRYQSAVGLESDLRRCMTEWEASKRILPFGLGSHDAPSQLQFREELYGREVEIERLLAAFDRVVMHSASELVLVSGYSGIGKSSIVNELQAALVSVRGLFAVGKFDQYKRGIPYATLAQASQGLVRQLLCKGDDELARWRNELTQALGMNGQLMVNLVPDLALIIGEQPPVPDLSGPETLNRFLLAFRQFLRVFARKQHPLVLFLDDLQWLDSATLDVFEHLATQSDLGHLLLVGAYRENEVGPEHPLTRRLKIIRGAGRPIQEIVLRGLRPEDVTRMIADALEAKPGRVDLLARTVHAKTEGNPFFTVQFVSALADEGLLTYDPPVSTWRWQIDRISAKSVSDNVIDLMIERLRRLPDHSFQIIKQLACVGSSVSIAKSQQITGISEHEAENRLHDAVRAGLLFRTDGNYAFAHDRVREAAYEMLTRSERAEIHQRIALRLMSTLSDPK